MRVTPNLAGRCYVWRAGAYAVTADRADICQRRPPRKRRFDNFSIGLLL